MLRWILVAIGVVVLGTLAWVLMRPAPGEQVAQELSITATPIEQTEAPTATPAEQSTPAAGSEPVADFEARITKKPFGIYVTPQDSPVQPEHFTGYHTGADSEYGDVDGDVPVRAITDGEVVVSRTAQGYGGVMVIRHKTDGKTFLALYGHLKPSSMLKVNTNVATGDQIGILGKGFTSETDGERKHLHFAIINGTTPTIRGYVQTKAELSGWEDPVEFLKSL